MFPYKASASALVALLAITVGIVDVYASVRLGHDFDIALITAGFGALGVTTVRVNGKT